MACERKFFQQEEDIEQDEEALSLSDLPIDLIKEDNMKSNESDADEESRPLIKSGEDFDFRSWSRESEMCAADDVFFQGQILPLRHSISSENGLTKFKPENLNTSNCVSRSESMDHYGSSGGFTSSSSRSSSTKSHYSSSSTSSTSTTTARNPIPRIRNQFHTHPSPKPQIRVSSTPTIPNRSRKSPIWEFFRLGLVRTPGIELQDLKVRSSVCRNRSNGSSNNSSICSINRRDKTRSSTSHSEQSRNMEKLRKQSKDMFFDRDRLLSGCSCSVGSAVKPVPQKIVVIKTNCDGNNHNIKGSDRESKENLEKRLQELKMKKKELMMEKQLGKQNESRHRRTFEWIKELSHGSRHPDS